LGRIPRNAKIVGSVINLAKTLGLPVIVEGIEDRQELQEVIRRGGEYGQGYYFGKAMPAAGAAASEQAAIQASCAAKP
jgi:EAL domain-containing protein (putative c-di-GMP-specific phosphodiesterase class I)